MMMETARTGDAGPSLRSAIAEALRVDILNGHLLPGSRIAIADIQGRFDVSLGAVREALLALAADGLAISQDRRGFRVAPVSREDLEDLARTRVEIETFAIRDAIANGTTAWEAEIVAALHRLNSLSPNAGWALSNEWYLEHRRFHETLVSASPSWRMKRFCATLHEQFERYCRISMLLRQRTNGKPRNQHKSLADAIVNRNADRAATLMSDHVWGTARAVLRSAGGTFDGQPQ